MVRERYEEIGMPRCGHRVALWGIGCAIGLAATIAWAQTATPPTPAKGKLERLRIAVAPVGWDTKKYRRGGER